MNKKFLFLSICALMLSMGAYAQIKISAELRPRTEYNHGVKSPAMDGQDASIITSQRTRINLNFKNESFAFGVVMQDVRLWGAEKQLTNNANNDLYLHQAWGEWFMSDKFSLKAGRQELAYDDHRMLGTVGWAQQGRSHDVAVFKYQGSFNAHLGLAYNNESIKNDIYTGPNTYKAMQYLWLNHKTDSYSGSILFLNNGKAYWKDAEHANQGISYSKTLGTHINTKIAGLKLAGNFYYQFGEEVLSGGATEADIKVDLAAYNFMIDAMYAIGDKANVGAGYEILSGTDEDSDKLKSFTPLYGTNHKFNGFMDYFYVGNHGNSVGLHDMYIKANVMAGKVKVNGAVHVFNADAKVPDMSKGLGTEIDLWFGYSHKGQVKLDFGFSHMIASDTLYAIKGIEKNSTGNNWAWVQLTFKPTLFEKK